MPVWMVTGGSGFLGGHLLERLGSEGLERDLAFRTRLLDAAWGGVPSLSVAGGSLAEELENAGAGDQILTNRFTRSCKPDGVDENEYAELNEHNQRQEQRDDAGLQAAD